MVFSTIVKGLKQRSIQVLIVLTVYVLLSSYLSLTTNQLFYTLSLFIKDSLLWIMPVTVGFFIAHTVQSFERRAPIFVLILLSFEAFSNFSSVWYAFFSAHSISDYLPAIQSVSLESDFKALWRLPAIRPSWWSADKGALAGLVLGGISAFSNGTYLKRVINQGKAGMQQLLIHGFCRLIPVYILGFVAQMYQTQFLTHILSHYAVIVMWLTLFLAIYLVLLFALGAGWSITRMVINMKNLLPAGGIALTSACSLSTMPWTIEATAKTLRNPDLAKALIPATTNIQQIGDCIANAFLCFLIYKNFYGTTPDLITWLHFSVVFMLARFATAAVQGGAIFIMLPIYETYLDFNGEMIALILALNVVLDPLITSCNVLANGALCRTFESVWNRVQSLLGKPQAAEIKVI